MKKEKIKLKFKELLKQDIWFHVIASTFLFVIPPLVLIIISLLENKTIDAFEIRFCLIEIIFLSAYWYYILNNLKDNAYTKLYKNKNVEKTIKKGTEIYISDINNPLIKKALKNLSNIESNMMIAIPAGIANMFLTFAFSAEICCGADPGTGCVTALMLTVLYYWLPIIFNFQNDYIIDNFLNTIIIKQNKDLIIYHLGNSNIPHKKISKNQNIQLIANVTQDYLLSTINILEYEKSINDMTNKNLQDWQEQLNNFLDNYNNEDINYNTTEYFDCTLIKETKKYYLIEASEKIYSRFADNSYIDRKKIKIYKVYLQANDIAKELDNK